MRKEWKKQMKILGLAILCSFSLIGCGQEKGPEPAQKAEGKETPVQEPEEKEAARQPEEADGEGAQENEKGGTQNPASESEESLTGDIREVGEKTFVIAKGFQEETEDGGLALGVPADDADVGEDELLTVSYDENTAFEKQTIWDGGARHEETEGSSKDLEKGKTAEILGYYEGQVFYAKTVRVIEVVL